MAAASRDAPAANWNLECGLIRGWAAADQGPRWFPCVLRTPSRAREGRTGPRGEVQRFPCEFCSCRRLYGVVWCGQDLAVFWEKKTSGGSSSEAHRGDQVRVGRREVEERFERRGAGGRHIHRAEDEEESNIPALTTEAEISSAAAPAWGG